MSFIDHVEALRWHVIRSVIVVFVMAIFVFIKVEWIFDHIILGPAHNDFIAYKWFCWLARVLHIDALCLGEVTIKFQNTEMAGQFVMALSVSLFLGFILSFPYILWELWKFIKPALKPTEIKYARGLVFWCSVLFFVGVLFAYYIIAPYTINFFGSYQLSPAFQNIITMDNYYDTMNDLILGMGIVFELPIIVYFLSRVGILTPKILREKRRYAILILFILAEVITPPDWFSCFLVFIPLYILYELSVMVSNRAMKERKKRLAARENS
ncbi:MAG: twin-arginine translocase subunit TatC [Flavipsychrobacter sp.]